MEACQTPCEPFREHLKDSRVWRQEAKEEHTDFTEKIDKLRERETTHIELQINLEHLKADVAAMKKQVEQLHEAFLTGKGAFHSVRFFWAVVLGVPALIGFYFLLRDKLHG